MEWLFKNLSNIISWDNFLSFIVIIIMLIAITVGLKVLLAKRADCRIDDLQFLYDEVENLNLASRLEDLHEYSQYNSSLQTPFMEVQQIYSSLQQKQKNCFELLKTAEELYYGHKYKKANALLEKNYDTFVELDTKSKKLFKILEYYLIHHKEDFNEEKGEYHAVEEPLQASYEKQEMEKEVSANLIHKEEMEFERGNQDKTIISKNCIIDGNLEVSGNLEIYGKVNGNVTCQGYLTINNAQITGDIASEKLDIQQSNIQGNMAAQEVHIFQGTKINGDMAINVLLNQGTIEGTVEAKDFISMSADGTIIGDVTTSDIEIARGAVLLGKLTMNQK